MNGKTFLVTLATLAVAVAITAQRASAVDFVVIVNAANPVSSLSKDQTSKMFLKKVLKWEDGAAVVPVDQAQGAAVRAAFSQAIHGRSASAIASYWQQQIFAGKDLPPVEKSGDAAIIAFVKANPGAIGYISASAPVKDVKVLVVN
jgi:ABC-type phosphate transport system substrate-binding protein